MISGIVLAAGGSSRLGRPKQLLPYRGRPMIQHAAEAAAAVLDEAIIVLGHAAEEITSTLALPEGARTIVNPDWERGQSTSLQAALRAASPDARAAVVILGDQPGIGAEHIRAVIDAYERIGGPVVQTRYGGRPGHPVLFDRGVWDALMGIEGDKGARQVLRAHPEWITPLDVPGDPPPDVDTWEDYERLTGEP